MVRWKPKAKLDYHSLALMKNFQWLGPLPERTVDKTWWVCHCGNIFQQSYKRVRDKAGYCSRCHPSRPKNEADYHYLAVKNGIKWVDQIVPLNTKHKTLWECSEGHQWKASYASVCRSPRSGCRECSTLKGPDNPNWNGGGGKAGAAHRRRAREAKVPSTFSEADWENALKFWDNCCAYCGSQGKGINGSITQDHFIPLAGSGGYVSNNIVPACLHCNSSKKDNNPLKWLVETFGDKAGCHIYSNIEDYFKALC